MISAVLMINLRSLLFTSYVSLLVRLLQSGFIALFYQESAWLFNTSCNFWYCLYPHIILVFKVIFL